MSMISVQSITLQMRQIMASLTQCALLPFFYVSGDLCVRKISALGIMPRSHGKILIRLAAATKSQCILEDFKVRFELNTCFENLLSYILIWKQDERHSDYKASQDESKCSHGFWA